MNTGEKRFLKLKDQPCKIKEELASFTYLEQFC